MFKLIEDSNRCFAFSNGKYKAYYDRAVNSYAKKSIVTWYGLYDMSNKLKFKFKDKDEATKKSFKYFNMTGKSLAIRSFEALSCLYDE